MKRGFSLIEILLAVALFSLVASLFIFLIIESYKMSETARDVVLATDLAEEGMEVVRSIRDYKFADLKNGTYGLAIENNRWILKGRSELIGKFTRQIIISSAGTNRKKIEAVVFWQPRTGPRREVRLFSRITNWVR